MNEMNPALVREPPFARLATEYIIYLDLSLLLNTFGTKVRKQVENKKQSKKQIRTTNREIKAKWRLYNR